MSTLEERHLADLRFSEVTRALRALSSIYVERRRAIDEGGVFSGAGKRAAFALFYSPIHFLLIRHIVSELAADAAGSTIVDMGCGTGAAGAAWAASYTDRKKVLGVDRHRWALDEAERTFRVFDIPARTRQADFASTDFPRSRSAFVAAFSVNELSEVRRDDLLQRLLERAAAGDAILIVEPVSGAVSPWWNNWAAAFEQAGGRSDTWRARLPLPPLVEKLDRAAGLNHRELKARSLFLGRRR
jgi:SAM-dependent methyltransferase